MTSTPSVREHTTPDIANGFTADEVELIKRTVAQDTTDDELALFLKVAQSRGLNPFAKQIYAIVRNDRDSPTGKKMTIQTSIDGYRLIAQRSGEYAGQLGPLWCGADGEWRDVWFPAEPPKAAKVAALRTGFREPLWRVALWDEYVQKSSSGHLTRMWRARGASQLAKCAEALALRSAFPEELSGIYTDAEMGQADNVAHEHAVAGELYPGDDLDRKGADDDHRALVATVETAADQLLADGLIAPKQRDAALEFARKGVVQAERSLARLEELQHEHQAGDGEPAQGELVDAEAGAS